MSKPSIVVAAASLLLLGGCAARQLVDSTLGLSEVVWSPERSGVYIGSPSIVELADGSLLASSDRFGAGFEGAPRNASVYSSADGGITWQFVSWVQQQYWSTLFTVPAHLSFTGVETVYLLGTSSDKQAGIHISRSTDGGASWAGAAIIDGYWQTGATPVVLNNGRLYRAVERFVPPYRWGYDFQATLISADVGVDLLDASAWSTSQSLPFDDSWVKHFGTALAKPAYLEGNAVRAPAGEQPGVVMNVLRFNSEPLSNLAAVVRMAPNGTMSFQGFVEFPGGMSKFTIRFDDTSGYYISFTNNVTNLSNPSQRNVLTMTASLDLQQWRVCDLVLSDDTGFNDEMSEMFTAFSYVDWMFDNNTDDVIMTIRTAYRGAASAHNSNRLTFKRLPGVRATISRCFADDAA
uniref:Exo-alpha-sialidase n=1 Tax=Bicosoecida sp. CB-2014 TaxID=1486930 RepID=A0A7S1G4J4_9STRA|mmetsp:Transcript_13084/g.45761  ORF Transcript_13084/g.45761 Transcript_13084/m.45761 type:complete len:406 (+) Transcript_13084:101-1318(+)